MSLSTAILWLVLAGLALLTARREAIVDWLGNRVTFWRLMAFLFERPARRPPATSGAKAPFEPPAGPQTFTEAARGD